MDTINKKIGLALSGGGFRASLFHLGLVRFLRDAGLLSQVTHITSVSGGSVLAAHLVLNWDRYNGSPKEFDAAAAELLEYVRLDVRNRIARRFPLTLPLRWPYRLLGRSTRRLARTGLLEYHYERYLYGDTSLFELPEKPQLHILATNLSEGSLCSFNRNGLLMVKRRPRQAFHIERVHVGLATVAMAVAASSAFPGFFPPMELTGFDVGANEGDFGRQSYTDGGVFDNLAIRMFRCLERPLLSDSPLARDDFFDFDAVVDALAAANRSSDDSPLRRLAQKIDTGNRRAEESAATGAAEPLASFVSLGGDRGEREQIILSNLWDVLQHDALHRAPSFAGIKPLDPDAESFLRACQAESRILDAGDQLWLNRHLMEAAFRQATGKNCFRRLNSGLDGVLVSDVGKPIKIESHRRAGGLIRTALRASEILMDRVWQLESETFQDTPGFVFAPIAEVVEPAEDATVLNPEIQRQAAGIRTDLDRFSDLEISALVRHGYCVARKACRSQPDLFGADLPTNTPWDPIPAPRSAAPLLQPAPQNGKQSKEPSPVTVEARKLQDSHSRRIWSTLLDYRDWVSYIYVPIIVPILVLLPYFISTSYERSHRLNKLMKSLAQGSRDLQVMTALLDRPMTPWTGVTPEEGPVPDETDLKNFEILQDSRILDLRNWQGSAESLTDPSHFTYCHQRLKVVKRAEGRSHFRMRLLPESPYTQVRFPRQSHAPKVHTSRIDSPIPGQARRRWDMSVDLQSVPVDEPVDIVIEFLSPGLFLREGQESTTLSVAIQTDTAEVNRWLLLPEGKEYRSFRLVRYPTDEPEHVEEVKVVTEYLAEDSTILAYKLLSVSAGDTYDLTWFYK